MFPIAEIIPGLHFSYSNHLVHMMMGWTFVVFILFTGAAKEDMDLRNTSFILKDPNDNAAFLPFGSGSRACVGQKFVIHGVATLFASLLESYEVCANSLLVSLTKYILTYMCIFSNLSCFITLHSQCLASQVIVQMLVFDNMAPMKFIAPIWNLVAVWVLVFDRQLS